MSIASRARQFRQRALRPRRIPIKAAREIAKKYNYDQVIVIARRVGEDPDPRGEHITTYGVNKKHCEAAALQGNKLAELYGWGSVEPLVDDSAKNSICDCGEVGCVFCGSD